MKESVGFEELELKRNSFILTGLTLRTFSAVASDWRLPVFEFAHETLPTRSPLKAEGPEVTLKVALTVEPAATGSANFFEISVVPETKEVHCFGTEMLNVTPVAGSPLMFVKVAEISCDDPGANVCSLGGLAVAEAGARVSRGRSYLAATMLACTN